MKRNRLHCKIYVAFSAQQCYIFGVNRLVTFDLHLKYIALIRHMSFLYTNQYMIILYKIYCKKLSSHNKIPYFEIAVEGILSKLDSILI